MKQKLTLLLIALVTSMGAWATDVTWESIHGWTQSSGGVGNFKWYGVHTPGDNTITYTMSSIQLKQCAGGDNNTNYLAIATVSPGASSTIVEANVLAVSSNSIQATTSTLYEYTFTTPVTLTGGTTYYLVFVTANTPADNAYNIQTGRMEVNHVKYDKNFTYGPYSYGNSANVDWWPYFTATLTTSAAITNYNYSCKNLAGYEFCSGTLPQASAPTKDQAPNLGDYYSCQSVSIDGTDVTFTYALTENPLVSATTSASDMATKPKYTTIESVAGGFVYYAEEGGAVKGWSPYEKDGDDAHWIIVGDEANGYKLYNANTGTSKVAVVADENGAAIQMKDEASNTASLFDIRYIFGAYRLYKKGTKWCTNRLSSGTRLIGIHENVNDGSNTVVTRYSKEITYKLKWNNEEIASESISVPSGDATSDHLPSEWERAYCNYTYDVSYVTTETSTVNVTIDWDGPFDISSDYASAKWYYLALNDKWAQNNKNWTAPNLSMDITCGECLNGINDGLWAFIGNPYDGIVLMLKQKYMNTYEMYLSALTSNPVFNYEIGSTEKWKVEELTSTTFALSCGDKYLTENTTYSRMDDFQEGITKATAGVCKVRSYYCQEAINDVNTWAASNHLDEYFGIDPTCLTTIENMFVTMFPNMDESTYEGITIPDDITPSLVTKYPSAGYYRIKNNSTGRYIGYGQPTATGLSKDAGLIVMPSANAVTDASSIIYLNVSAGTYKLSTQGLYVQSQKRGSQAFPATVSSPGVDFVFTHDNFSGIASITNVASYVDENNDGSLHNPSEGWILPGVVNWKASAPASKWVVEDATSLTINPTLVGGKYYATLCLPFTVTLSGATAYTLSLNGSKNALTLSEGITEVPAGTPVLLRGDDAEVTASIEYNEDYQAAPLTSTALTGTYVSADVNGNTDYFLGYKDGQIGFYHWTGSTLGANRAYFEASKLSGSVKGFVLNFDDVDAVTDVPQSVPATSEWYDLSGRRINQPTQGLYIKNGKKVLVK